ncbi:MAG: sugar isomerase [Bryobacteraceae bacterium]
MNDYNPCRCCHTPCAPAQITRRGLFAGAGAALFPVLEARPMQKEPGRQAPILKTLAVQPVLTYATPRRREATSWRSWGAIQTEQDAAQEKARIEKETAALKTAGVEFRPVAMVKNAEDAAKVIAGDHDLTLVYAAGCDVKVQEILAPASKWAIMFVRHKSGPVYLWYEIAHPRFLRKTVDEYGQPGMDYQDVVVDSQSDLAWRLRALSAVKNTLGKRIVAVGGAAGWGAGGRKAAQLSRDIFKLDIQTVTYPDLGERIKKARADGALAKRAGAACAALLKQKGVKLETDRKFVENAFVLTEVFRDLLDQAQTDAITINQCMGTIMGISETSACLPLSILNDEGYMAFCESDFVVIPSGILLKYIARKPVFLNDPTYPHHGVVTIAHCTAPRKMDGDSAEPTRLVTHFESDYGASPKVDMRKGAKCTNLVPDFSFKKWVGFEGEIVDSPFLPICRAQVDVQIKGSCDALARDMKGFHWMTSYGEHLKECGYALKKVGIEMQGV